MTAAAALMDGNPSSVGVFRALNLGDMLCCIPALRALRRRLPRARITLIGLESARPVVRRFGRYIDELVLFPGHPAFPEQAARIAELPGFYRRIKDRRFDLALQMHGSGAQSNAIVRAMGARHWGGFVPDPAQQEPGRFMAWPDDQPEIIRYLSLLSYLGVPDRDARLEFPLEDADHEQADRAARQAGLDLSATVFIHPGARLASRRWPAERFAAVAAGLARQGWQVAVTGSGAERALADSVVEHSGAPVANLCGSTSLGALASLLQRARLLVCNDTGISHVAAAVRLPSVVIASGSDAARWAPLDASRHNVLYAQTACRPCAYDQCSVGHPCALAIGVEQVLACAAGRLGAGAPR